MIEHVGIPVRDYKKAKAFYTAALKPVGYKLQRDYPEWQTSGFLEGGHTSFWISVPAKNFAPAHIAFLAKSKAAVAKFHQAAIAAGGKDNGAPGFRLDYGPDYYAAFVLDPWGNNIEACYFGERAPKSLAATAKKSAKKAAPKKRAQKPARTAAKSGGAAKRSRLTSAGRTAPIRRGARP
ncbi:MAG: VOC family protein [Patescibacteria group bacterium]|nr:VOC family protein [Patescibacteria group bacterium]MDE1944425.1 VOC family protein [Patescibacteria group bacterium]MDE1945110.1 VOC family protein [Patescibacteria group bacterium]MDE2057620.1 VOC family protein [Patescibacteria group bacterium]